MLKRVVIVILALVAFTLPSHAAKRSVHLFGETYVFNFTRDFVFTRRVDMPDGSRQTVTFNNGNRSLVVSASRYDAARTEPLASRESFVAKAETGKATGITYVNEETDNGKGGSSLVGFCKQGSCMYRMSRALGQKYWVSVIVLCAACTPAQAEDSRTLADTLYQQLKTF